MVHFWWEYQKKVLIYWCFGDNVPLMTYSSCSKSKIVTNITIITSHNFTSSCISNLRYCLFISALMNHNKFIIKQLLSCLNLPFEDWRRPRLMSKMLFLKLQTLLSLLYMHCNTPLPSPLTHSSTCHNQTCRDHKEAIWACPGEHGKVIHSHYSTSLVSYD